MTYVPVIVPEFHLTVDGQSLPVQPNPAEPGGTLMWEALRDLIAPDGVKTDCIARGGISYTGLAVNVDRRASSARIAQTTVNLLIGGTSDLFLEGNSGAQTYADMGAYADLLRAEGYDLVIGTPVTPSTIYTGGLLVRWTQANALIRDDANQGQFFDLVIDLEQPPIYDPDDSTYYFDGLHWTEAGAAAAAAICYPEIKTLLGI